jgi:XisH protein
MPAKDKYHQTVRNALVKDGWEITDDPLHLRWGKRDLYVDLGAEKLFTAEKNGRKIAVEVKSFIGASEIKDLEDALGQYVLYRNKLKVSQPDRELYLAIRESVFVNTFSHEDAQFLLENEHLQLLVFNSAKEEIVKWIH